MSVLVRGGRALLQLALDAMALEEAVALTERVAASVDIVEAGTPLIKREGMRVVAELRRAAPGKPIFADMKIMDGGALEAGMAFEAGAAGVSVLAAAPDATVRAVVSTARQMACFVVADLIGVQDVVGRARGLATLGVDAVAVHRGVDETRSGTDPLAVLAALAHGIDLPIVVAGGIDLAAARRLRGYAPSCVVVGSAITGATDPAAMAVALRDALSGDSGDEPRPAPVARATTQTAIRVVTSEIADVGERIDPGEVLALEMALEMAARVFVGGEGRSGSVARMFAKRLMHLGMTAYVVGETTTPPIGANDLLVAISGSGGTMTTSGIATAARRAGGRVAAVTAEPTSSLGAGADLLLIVPAPAKGGLGGSGSMQYEGSLFEQGALVALEAVVYDLMLKRGSSNEALRVRHANLE